MNNAQLAVNQLESESQPDKKQSIGQPTSISSIIIRPAEVMAIKPMDFQRYRQQALCSSCHQDVITKTERKIAGGAWAMCCMIFFIGGFLGCCCIPFCMKSCRDVIHRCPQCNQILGRKIYT